MSFKILSSFCLKWKLFSKKNHWHNLHWSNSLKLISILCRTLDSLWYNIMYDHSWFARNIQQMGSNPILQSYSLVFDCETTEVVKSPRKWFFYNACQIYLWGVLFQAYFIGSLRHNLMKTFALFTARGQRQIGLQNCFFEVFPYVPFW